MSLSDGVWHMKTIEHTGHSEGAEFRAQTRMGEKGRFVVPAQMRDALGMEVGRVLDLRIVDGELRISTLRSRIRRAQERASRYVKPGTLVSEELSAERREAARNE